MTDLRIEFMAAEMRHIMLFLLVLNGFGGVGCRAFRDTNPKIANKSYPSHRIANIDHKHNNSSHTAIRLLDHDSSNGHRANGDSADGLVTVDSNDDYFASRKNIEMDPFRSHEDGSQQKQPATVLQRLLADQKNYYSGDSLLGLGGAFAIGGVFANTQLDHQIQKHFQSSVAGATSDEWFEFLHANKELGEGIYTLPIMGAAWLSGEVFDGSPQMERFGDWGGRSTRGFVVGAMPMIIMQRVTGASRPGETAEGSKWNPLQDENGVSGHAFMSSLPFITAAKMTDNPVKKSLWYLGSAIGPLSRVNDNAHYPSQIGLGWAMAYVAATAVHQTENGDSQWRLVPYTAQGGSGLTLEYQW